MANRGYEPLPSDWDGRGEDGSDHSTGPRKGAYHAAGGYNCDIQDVVGLSSVAEQYKDTMSRQDKPYSDNGSMPPPHRLQGGAADGGRYDVAAERGVPNPTPGTTY